MVACGASAATSGSSLAFSMNVRAVTTSAISAAAAGGDRRRRAGREVEHRRHAPFGLQGEERDDRRARRRQQHADALARPRPRAPARAPSAKLAVIEAAVGQRPQLDVVGDDVAAAVLLTRLEQRVEQRRVDRRGREHRLHHLVAERAAQRGAPRAAGHAFGRGQPARRQDADADAREPAAAGPCRPRRENGVNSTPSMRTRHERAPWCARR